MSFNHCFWICTLYLGFLPGGWHLVGQKCRSKNTDRVTSYNHPLPFYHSPNTVGVANFSWVTTHHDNQAYLMNWWVWPHKKLIVSTSRRLRESMFSPSSVCPSVRPSVRPCVRASVRPCVLAVCERQISVAVGPVAAKVSTHIPWMPI